MCECDKSNLGLDITHLKQLIHIHKPAAIILVHVLGIPNHMDEIMELCKKHDILLIEDSCEAIGSKYNGKNIGTFGELSTFSFYFGHHMSTIEGGMISTDDEDLYHILLSIRSHGWDRDLPEFKQKELREKYNITDFRALYTFYYPGFNLRATDLQAFIGLSQLNKIDEIVEKRNKNFKLYQDGLKEQTWKVKEPDNSFVSNFAYPIITTNIKHLVEKLKENNIDCRPLICGSIQEHPFWYEKYSKSSLPIAENVHLYGLYVPNNHQIIEEEINRIITIVNKYA